VKTSATKDWSQKIGEKARIRRGKK